MFGTARPRIRDGSVDLYGTGRGLPSIAEGEFLPPKEQSNSEDDLVGDQGRPRRPLDKSLLNEALFARWIRRRRRTWRILDPMGISPA